MRYFIWKLNVLLSVNSQRPVESSNEEMLERYTEIALDTSNENKQTNKKN